MPLIISSAFDAGAIEVLALDDPQDIRLAIRADSHAEFRQWFHFRLQGARGIACRLQFTNAAECTYVDGWRDYAVVASYDRREWFRVPTSFDGKVMTVAHTPETDSVFYAYFEPYSWERHLDRLGRVAASPLVRVTRLGASVEGRDLDMVTVGEAGAARLPVWVIARQHPGETMAEWFVEGMLERLLDPADAIARTLLQRAAFHVVPNMNPDGSVRGNLRTNAAGANLNREWLAPTAQRSPEVLCVREAMERTGVAAFLDVHGDEGLPYVFVEGCERLPSFSQSQSLAQRAFTAMLSEVNPDFQTEHGYPADKDTKVNLALASKWVGNRFGCLSLTLEMPFKDNANLPDARRGWDGARSRGLGADCLVALRSVLSSATLAPTG
jgi:murein tripeptide amidase MpaA